MRPLAIALTTLLLATPRPAPSNTRATDLNHPFGKANPFFSPDHQHALWGDYANSELELEDTATYAERPVTHITVQTLSLAWSPDSRHFAVNDRLASDLEDAFLYDTTTLQRINLRTRLAAAKPEVARYYLTDSNGALLSHGRNTLHSYLHVVRWLDAQHVELELHGNTSARFAHDNPDSHLYPAQCFDLRYKAGIDGSIHRIHSHIFNQAAAPKDDACGWGGA